MPDTQGPYTGLLAYQLASAALEAAPFGGSVAKAIDALVKKLEQVKENKAEAAKLQEQIYSYGALLAKWSDTMNEASKGVVQGTDNMADAIFTFSGELKGAEKAVDAYLAKDKKLLTRLQINHPATLLKDAAADMEQAMKKFNLDVSEASFKVVIDYFQQMQRSQKQILERLDVQTSQTAASSSTAVTLNTAAAVDTQTATRELSPPPSPFPQTRELADVLPVVSLSSDRELVDAAMARIENGEKWFSVFFGRQSRSDAQAALSRAIVNLTNQLNDKRVLPNAALSEWADFGPYQQAGKLIDFANARSDITFKRAFYEVCLQEEKELGGFQVLDRKR